MKIIKLKSTSSDTGEKFRIKNSKILRVFQIKLRTTFLSVIKSRTWCHSNKPDFILVRNHCSM